MSGHHKWADVKAEMMRKHMSATLGNLPYLYGRYAVLVENISAETLPLFERARADVLAEVERLIKAEQASKDEREAYEDVSETAVAREVYREDC